MATNNNVLGLRRRRPLGTKQLAQLIKMGRQKNRIYDIVIRVLSNSDPFRLRRIWRIMFGAVQDYSSVKTSVGFKKSTRPFAFGVRSEMLARFLEEATPYIDGEKIRIYIDGERVRRNLNRLRLA